MHTLSFTAALLLTGRLAAFGQASPGFPAATWLDSVRQLPLPGQVAAVRARLLTDTVLRHHPQYACLMPLSAAQRAAYYRAEQPRAQAELARPVGELLLYVVDGYALADNHSAPTEAFVRQLDARRIRHITYLTGPRAAAIYGSRAANGVVILSSK